jgi:hypothetical protein
MNTGQFTTVIPSARRLMASLRDIGYDLGGAVADLVDNSLDANARNVEITLHFAGRTSWLRVCDDGLGMRRGELDEAMRYGSHQSYGDRTLGQFGLGLKTASLSQCRRLTVGSRRAGGRIAVRRWDLDLVAQQDVWVLERPTSADWPDTLIAPLRERPGTVVLWEDLDRIISMRRPDGALAKRAFDDMASEIATHLGMVFHRFLSGETSEGRRPISIIVNGQPVSAWDPYAREEEHTRSLPAQALEVEAGVFVEVRPYLLPHQSRFSSIDAHHAAAGPHRWNRAQGFYFYRRDRLIQAGGWNRLRTADEHAKLARIAVDLPAGHEELFQINVAKMRLVIPPELRPALRTLASAVVADAQRAYREAHEEPDLAIAESDDNANGMAISRDWPLILSVLADELADDRAARDRILLRLANECRDPERDMEPSLQGTDSQPPLVIAV